MTLASLGLAVDSSSVSAAAPALEKMTAASVKAEGAAAHLGRASTEAGKAFDRMSSSAVANANKVSAALTGMRFQTAGLAAQFQDVGVTAAMGMNPLMIGLQQGTQLAGQLATMANPIKGLGQAIVSLLSPVSLLSVGFTALLAVGIQWGASLLTGASNASKALAESAMSLDQVKSATSSLSSVTDTYARSILDTGHSQTAATASILANTEKEFNAKKSLLELELKRQQALITTQQLELSQAQGQLRKDISVAMPSVDDLYASPYAPSPMRINRNEALGQYLENSPLVDKIKEMRANLTLTEVATANLQSAIGTTFSQSVAASVDKVGGSVKKTRDNVRSLNDDFADLAGTTMGFRDVVTGVFGDMGSTLSQAFTKGGNTALNVLDAISQKAMSMGEKLMNSGLNALLDMGLNALTGALTGSGPGFSYGPTTFGDPWGGLRLAGGGPVRGPGSATSDSIPALLSNGEYVVNSDATRQHRLFLDAINFGGALRMAEGGLVGRGGEGGAELVGGAFHDRGLPVSR